jgi:hypothetical protein
MFIYPSKSDTWSRSLMRHCKCGSAVTKDARFCAKCGRRYTSFAKFSVPFVAFYVAFIVICVVIARVGHDADSVNVPAAIPQEKAATPIPGETDYAALERKQMDERKKREKMDRQVEAACGSSPSDNYPNDGDVPLWHMLYVEEHKAQSLYRECAAKALKEPTHPAYAQTVRSTTVNQNVPAVSDANYSSASFDTGLSVLPPNFKGHDIERLYKAMKASGITKPKSEFESTVHYDQRQTAFGTTVVIGQLIPADKFAFVLNVKESAITIEYDADRQSMSFLTHPADSLSPPASTMEVKRRILSRNKFRTSEEAYGVAVSNEQRAFTWLHVDTSLPMSPEKAQLKKKDLRLLLVCTLTKPWIREDEWDTEPTTDFPRAVHLLQVIVDEVWIFDLPTGEILWRLKAVGSMPP